MSRVRVAAFEPFGGRRKNRSLEALRRLEPAGVETATLPVWFQRLPEVVPPLVEGTRALILVGESREARRPVLERIAVNLIDARMPDNAGERPEDLEVVAGGPAAYLSSWPARRLLEALSAHGIAAELSAHAGTYACNAALYLALHHAAGLPSPPPIGFLHVPARRPYADDVLAARTLRVLVDALGEFD